MTLNSDKETVEYWMRDGDIFTSHQAVAKEWEADGHEVVHLVGQKKRKPRKVSTEVYVCPEECLPESGILWNRLGFSCWMPNRTNTCRVRARLTLEEIFE